MSFADKALSIAGTAKTFALNFWPWLLAAFLLGAGVAGTAGFGLGKVIYERQALREKVLRKDIETAVATSAAETQAEARRLEGEAAERESARQDAIMTAIGAGWDRVLGQVRRDNLQLREAIHGPEYDCLRIPYPADALRLLERPGGAAGQAGDHPDPGTGENP